MKYIKTLVIAGFLLPLLFACSEDFLDKEKLGEQTVENFYTTEESALQAVNAAYESMQAYTYVSSRFVLGDIASDDALKGSEPGDFTALQEIADFTAKPGNTIVAWKWNPSYDGIYRANLVLKHVPDIDMDEELKQRLLAEAKFIRAFWNFEIVRSFGGDVPLINAPLKAGEYYEPEMIGTEEDFWNQIEKDLSEAAPDLSKKSEYRNMEELGRATKGAAYALLGKAHLYQEDWAAAGKAFSEVIALANAGEYALASDYSEIFQESGEQGPGSIFEIQFMQAGSGGQTTREGNFSTVFTMPRGLWGWGFDAPTQDFVDEFETDDPRMTASVVQYGETIEDELQEWTRYSTNTDYHQRKDFLAPSERPASWRDSPVNERIIRLADVYLMYAEALCEQNKLGDARTYLNRVRERAREGDTDILPDVTANTQDELRDAIYHERRVELGLEGHRYWDLIRTGRANDVLDGFKDVWTSRENRFKTLPIPQSEIDVSNELLKQNPGY